VRVAAIFSALLNDKEATMATAQFPDVASSHFGCERAATTISFRIGHCSLGAILVAAGANGVCAALLGEDADALTDDLQRRFPHARIFRGDASLDDLAATVIAAVEDPSAGIDLKLDMRGTAFQHKVWSALRDIRLGTTASYAEVARSIGQPAAVRAVAKACAANHLAVLVPCHRVVRSDGALSGYRWGLARKRALLAREASMTQSADGAT
jgi:AraC family transcriptional regulator of adaptative response/methylated-DNA-[protein]-cysteine methyltransferase